MGAVLILLCRLKRDGKLVARTINNHLNFMEGELRLLGKCCQAMLSLVPPYREYSQPVQYDHPTEFPLFSPGTALGQLQGAPSLVHVGQGQIRDGRPATAEVVHGGRQRSAF